MNEKGEWNSDLEQVVKKEGEQSQSLYWLHNGFCNRFFISYINTCTSHRNRSDVTVSRYLIDTELLF